MSSKYTIVEYFGGDDGHSCGYCKGADTSVTTGMWAHALCHGDYQDLVDRGWRRSGKYLYKPTMDRTCCPQYTIRCKVADFKPSKSHKRVLKRFRSYIISGKKSCDSNAKAMSEGSTSSSFSDTAMMNDRFDAAEKKLNMKSDFVPMMKPTAKEPVNSRISQATSEDPSRTFDGPSEISAKCRKKEIVPGLGADPNKPRARKAKDIRLERAMQKGKEMTPTKKPGSEEKTLEDLIDAPFPSVCAHKFEIRTVLAKTSNASFKAHFNETLTVYQKYQMKIHGDDENDCKSSKFTRFLCDASLIHEARDGSSGYGGFHQQYVIDGKIVAVGVVDVLRSCVSSVYLFYDPDFSFLSLGTLSSLFEISFTRKLARLWPEMLHYYMGFYIHACPKMRYKAQYSGSCLLCPETYTWVEFSKCKPLLDKSKYSKLNGEGQPPAAATNVDSVLVLHEGQAMSFGMYKEIRQNSTYNDDEITEYVKMIGEPLTKKILLYRS